MYALGCLSIYYGEVRDWIYVGLLGMLFLWIWFGLNLYLYGSDLCCVILEEELGNNSQTQELGRFSYKQWYFYLGNTGLKALSLPRQIQLSTVCLQRKDFCCNSRQEMEEK